VANDTVTVQVRLKAAFGTIQALRQALADEGIQGQLISLLGETVRPFLARQVEAEFDLAVALKVSAVSQVRPGPRLPLPKVQQGQLTWYDPYADRINTVGSGRLYRGQRKAAGALGLVCPPAGRGTPEAGLPGPTGEPDGSQADRGGPQANSTTSLTHC